MTQTLKQMARDERANWKRAATMADGYAQAEPHTCDGFLFAIYIGIAARHKERADALAEAQRTIDEVQRLQSILHDMHVELDPLDVPVVYNRNSVEKVRAQALKLAEAQRALAQMEQARLFAEGARRSAVAGVDDNVIAVCDAVLAALLPPARGGGEPA